jgi:dihydroorotase
MLLKNVNTQLKANQYLQETQAQLEKDFLMTGVGFDTKKPVRDYKSLFAYTEKLLHAIHEQNPKLLFNLLYRIDLSEDIVQEKMRTSTLSFNKMLAELIVKRELYKVFLRKNIS